MSGFPLLALCGSLRAQSSNREILEAYASVAAPVYSLTHYNGIGQLPAFNPDIDREASPQPVVEFRNCVVEAVALVISTPEYMHALPGAFKNALDWLASESRVYGKPVVILAAQRQSRFALDSLQEVLRTLSLTLIPEADVHIPLESNRTRASEILNFPCVREKLIKSVHVLTHTLKNQSTSDAVRM